ncbi:MAG: 50S ribosomal protein L25 [Patescibacteria group bacterium]
MNSLTLNVVIRKDIGKHLGNMRKSGKIPGIFYGFNAENTPIEIDYKEFSNIYEKAGQNTIIKLNIPGSNLKNDNILIQDVVKNGITDKIIHADLYAIRMDKKIKITVPLVFEGNSPLIKNSGGIMDKHISGVEIEVLPLNVPREIKVDIGLLKEFGDVIKIKDIALPENVSFTQDNNIVVVTVKKPKTEEEIKEELGGAPTSSVGDVKVVGKERKESDDETKDNNGDIKNTASNKKKGGK